MTQMADAGVATSNGDGRNLFHVSHVKSLSSSPSYLSVKKKTLSSSFPHTDYVGSCSLPGDFWLRSFGSRGRPDPDPPQLLHSIMPEPAQDRQPMSPSDHLEHRHATRPDPLHDGHRGHPPAMGRFSTTDFTMAAPASTPSPVAN
ncbi:hypothetical protein BHE74_00030221 [Ensete ventricosum]|nr:hypothetical protein BHE74_00030221 [Ensete ventricosum]